MSCGLALHLQRRRQEAERARDEARATSEVNRLLVSLVAHDLRAPLATAVQAIEYARGTSSAPDPGDPDLLRDVQLRLRRNLGSIDGVLRFFREDMKGGVGSAAGNLQPVDIPSALEAEVEAFREEAAGRGKPIRLTLSDECHGEHPIDRMVLRQATGILLDNSLRHARPGPITVSGTIEAGVFRLTVSDCGPALEAPSSASPHGAGVGLTLCRSLVTRAGGTVDVSREGSQRTRSVLALPLARIGAP